MQLNPWRGAFACLMLFCGVCHTDAQTWTALNNPPPTGLSLCLLLTSGSVICQSSTSLNNFYKLTPDINGSYLNGTWSQIAGLPAGYYPVAYGSAVLADGRVVIEGGEYDASGNFVLSNLGAIYDPKANTWSAISPPAGWSYIGDAPTAVLPNGQLLMGNKLNQQLALLDPSTLTWTVINPTGKIDGSNAEEDWTLLPDGSVFTLDVQNAPNSERYLPSTTTWVSAGVTPVDMASAPDEGPITVAAGVVYTPPGEVGPAVRLPNGTLFVEGGNGNNALFTPPPANSTAQGTWAPAPSFPSGLAVDDGPSAILPSGHVLAAVSPPLSTKGLAIFEFDGTNLNSEPNIPNASSDASNYVSLLLLPTGQVMLVDTSNIVEIYTPAGTWEPSWAPTISSVPANLTSGSTYQISGTQFNGLSQGTGGGDELENATNYPLVRITNNASGHVFYANTHDHSTMGVATGSTPVSTNFDVPASTELGASAVVVVANGIPSTPVPVTITNTVAPELTLACPASAAEVAAPYSSSAVAIGGQPPFIYSIATGSLPAGFTLNPNTGLITGTPGAAGSSSFTIQATDSFQTPDSVTASCTITTSVGPSVGFQGFDITTQGTWKGVYGKDGWIIANNSTNPPSYAVVVQTGAATWTWEASTTDPRALQQGASATNRIASTFYSSTSFTFDINLTDGQTHQVAFYCLDFDTDSRTQTITIMDANSHAVLDTRAMSYMQSGVYAIWNLQGHVIVQVTWTGGLNAVVSGLFFSTPPSGVPLPVVSITSPPAGAVSGSVTLTANAASSIGIASVQFQLDGSNLGSPVTGAGPNYSTSWSTLSATNGAHTLTAIATDTLGQQATSAGVAITVSNAGSGPTGMPFVTGYALNHPSLRDDFTGWVGMSLTVGANSLTVSALGRACETGNANTHMVMFVNASNGTDVPGAAAPVNMPGCTPGQFVYSSISPVTLSAGTTYYLVSQETQGGDLWYDQGAISTSSVAAVNGAIYSWNGSWYSGGAGSTSYVPPGFEYTTAGAAPQYLLTAGVSPSGSGSISASPSSAGGSYASGTIVQLTATPAAGCTFTSWSGGLSGTTNPQDVTMSGPQTVTANFQCTAPASTSFVTGYGLSGQALRNDFTGLVGMKLTTGANPVTVSALGRICVANNNQTHMVEFVSASNGAVVAGASAPVNMAGCTPGQFVFTSISPVTLPAATSYYLVSQETQGGDQWYDQGGISVTSEASVNNSLYFYGGNWISVNSANTSYVPPNFQYTSAGAPVQYVLTTNVSPPGSGSIAANPSAAGGSYASGTIVQLGATPAAGCTFSSWSGAVTGSANPTSITMSSAETVTANFQCSSPPPAGTAFLTGYGLSGESVRQDFTGFVGMKFTVGASPVTVSAVGRICVANNAQTHTVKFVNASSGSDVSGGSASVNMAGCTPGQFVYSTISPVTLPADASYYLVSQETQGGDLWYDQSVVSTTGAATVNTSVYSWNGSWETGSANASYVPPNFLY